VPDESQLDSPRRRPGHLADGPYWPVGVIALAALFLALPMLIYGPMPAGHDAFEQLNFTRHFAEQFWHGDLSPHWLLNMNHGLGSPTFFVYPPLAAYAYSLLAPAGEALHFSAFNLAAFLALFGSGVAAFLWIRTMASKRVSLAVAVLYMLMPYHLAADFYRRTALPEIWAFVWMPLVLYFATQVANEKRAVAGLATAYGLLLLSHPGAALILAVIPLLPALILAAPGRRLRSALLVGGGILLGIGLASFYFLPALYHSRYFPVSELRLPLSDNLVPLGRSLLQGNGFIRVLSLTAAGMLAFTAICALAAFSNAGLVQRKQMVLWLSLCVLSALLMSRFSAPFWKRLPWLLDAVQFPWRLNLLLCIAALPLAAVFLSQISRPLGFWRTSSLAFTVLLVATWLFLYGNAVKDYSDTTPFTHDPVNEADGWFAAWKAPGTDSVPALQASMEPRARFVSGQGAAQVLLWKPRLVEVETASSFGGFVMVNQFYYPEWKAQVIGEARPLAIEAALPQGLLAVQVPPGDEKVVIEIPVSRAEHVGRWLSSLSLLVCVALVWHGRR